MSIVAETARSVNPLDSTARRWGGLAADHPDDDARLWVALSRRLYRRCGWLDPRTYGRLRARLWQTYTAAVMEGTT